ncbi:MAG: nitronate monooxygenase [Bacteroidetes bacterium]|nr:MAG: nitronate monooxygenase [Bacteroidota bacterium]RLD88104.1 MAG: nitronate monooxygenase [Bacteroidota bacterium]
MEGLNIGDLRIKIPIIQGGMGVAISLSGLASAVANQGGVGVISAVGIGMTERDYIKNFRNANKRALRKEIWKARGLSPGGVIGVNIMYAASDFDDLLEVAIDEKIDVVFISAGLPLKKPDNLPVEVLENSGVKVIPKVSSAKAANFIFKYWNNHYNRVPDAIVIEGPLSGGHLGFKKNDLENPQLKLNELVKETVEVLKPYEEIFNKEIPVIAAGGIYTGKDIYNIMQYGAKGVKMGTRFVPTFECDADEKFKETYVSAKKEDIVMIDSPVGLPGRVVKNKFVEDILKGIKKPVSCPWKCLKTCDYKEVSFCIAQALFNAAQGKMEEGFAFAGTNAYLTEEIISVEEVFNQLKDEHAQQQERLEIKVVM